MLDRENVFVAGRELLQNGVGVVRAAVVDEHDFVSDSEISKDIAQPRVHPWDRWRVPITGDHR